MLKEVVEGPMGAGRETSPISFHTSEKTDPISTALPNSQFNFHRP